MDHWRQISTALDYKQYRSLRELINQNEETSKAELETKVGEWATQNGLTQDFKIFTDIQKSYRAMAATKRDDRPDEHGMSKIIFELAKINDDQSISFKEACRRQNKLVREENPEITQQLGLQNLINDWCK
jgi:hypothetical protein